MNILKREARMEITCSSCSSTDTPKWVIIMNTRCLVQKMYRFIAKITTVLYMQGTVQATGDNNNLILLRCMLINYVIKK
jgi:hypothetical protein